MLEMMGTRDLIHRYSDDSHTNYIHLSGTALYDELYAHEQIAHYFFGKEQLIFSGSRYPNRGEHDLLADYFGMSTTAYTTLCFNPRMSNFTTDLFWFTGLDGLKKGLYISARLPIVRAVWDLHGMETVTSSGVGHPAGYMGPQDIAVGDDEGLLVTHVSDFLRGNRFASRGDITPCIMGDIHEQLAYGRIARHQTATQIADIILTLGYNAIQNKRFSCSFFARGVLHTGEHSKAEMLFEPIIGNGGHWEVGAGCNIRIDCWQSEDANREISFCFDACLTHLFKADQNRSFDFKHKGHGSRYMLMTQLGTPSQNLFLGSPAGPASASQYQGRIVPAINETTLTIKTEIPLQADLLFTGMYNHYDTSIEFGYNFFARSSERCKGRDHFPSNLFALKGDAQVYGFDNFDNPVKLGATQSEATLHAGQKQTNFEATEEFANFNSDSPIIAANNTTNLNQLTTADSVAFSIPLAVIRTSQDPTLLTDNDIDVRSGLLPRLITHRLYLSVSHRWEYDKEKWTPFLGLNGYLEWMQEECTDTHPASWAIGIKGGVSF